MSDIQKIIAENVKQHGWHTQVAHGDSIWPTFVYTIGWGIERHWPEVIVVGQRPQVAHGMLSQIWENNDKPTAGQVCTNILPDFRCQLMEVDTSWYEFLFGAAIDFYMERDLPAFEALQFVWPTTSDVLPWERGAPDGFEEAQPLLNSKMLKEPGS